MNRYAIAALVWLASLVAVGFWQRHDGATSERSDWQERENTELATANETITRLQNAYRQQEQEHGLVMGVIGANYERKLDDANRQMEMDRAAARTGQLRLYDPAPRRCPDRDPGAPTVTGAGERDGATGGELSGEAAEFLLEEANRADRVVEQLGECQAVVRADREVKKGCTPENPSLECAPR